MSPKRDAQKFNGFTAEEQAAMKARAKVLKAEARANKKKADGENALMSAIFEMPEPDRSIARRLHEIIQASVPELWPKTWYGMPAYAKDEKVICYFQAASKFNVRYATLGFQQDSNLGDGAMWPTAFALKELTSVEETRIIELVKKAVN